MKVKSSYINSYININENKLDSILLSCQRRNRKMPKGSADKILNQRIRIYVFIQGFKEYKDTGVYYDHDCRIILTV